MIELIYNQLKTPKILQELLNRLNEYGLNWNMAQLELFVQLDSNVLKQDEKYYVNVGNTKDTVLDIIDKAIEGKPMIPVKKLMEQMPAGITEIEIIKAAIGSGRYKSPNNAVIMKI